MKKFVLFLLTALVVVGFTHTPASASAQDNAFPTYGDVNWSADGGAPVVLPDGATIYLFGDTVTRGSFTNNSAVITYGNIVIPLWHADSLLRGTEDSWFWPSDALPQEDGSLLVLANEITKDSTSWFGFRSIDTDVFVVRDPYSVMSWRLAEHIDAGPWDGYNVSFLSTTEAVVRPLSSDTTYHADMTTDPWTLTPIFTQENNATFIPAYHNGAWYGLVWDMNSGNVIMYRSTTMELDTWEPADMWHTAPNSYNHQLHDVDGQLTYVRSMPGNGYELGLSTAFPIYEILDF